MAQGKKIIKVNGGDAFIEVGEAYIRIGVGDKVFLTLDENTMTAGASSVNWQMAPEKHVYHGLLNQAPALAGLIPIGPKYSINLDLVKALKNAAVSLALISKATGIGI